jgi:tRNA pseudouridine13 synthase
MTEKYGFINYFGLQRFGTGNISTHLTGAALLSGDWEKAIGHILSPSSSTREDLKNALNIYLKEGNAKGALKVLPRGNAVQRSVLQVLAKQDGNSCLADALLSLPRNLKMIYIHAFQSYIWNKMASKRINMQETLSVMPGDLVLVRKTMERNRGKLIGKKRNAKSLYEKEEDDCTVEFEDDFVDPHEVTVDDCEKDLYSLEDIVLPVPGSKVLITGYAEDIYQSILDEFGIRQKSHNFKEFLLESFPGTYRHLICKPWNFEYVVKRYDSVDQDISFDDTVESGKF